MIYSNVIIRHKLTTLILQFNSTTVLCINTYLFKLYNYLKLQGSKIYRLKNFNSIEYLFLFK